MIELLLVEGVSDVQLISYFLQNVYGWKHEKSNALSITELDEYEHIERETSIIIVMNTGVHRYGDMDFQGGA